ncbi:Glucosamine 6-phosphate N-acetyltransferase [Mycena venus]|uniref:Glucosamine 6-phosphate N-acetyltransferase n=1 Tax=Mycena venus TaxID=2733690 RepID=A0A8H7DAK7_9AGAR|nr:Glucosamine 6-phosphate N-acetyltransferase [Mycena venus]
MAPSDNLSSLRCSQIDADQTVPLRHSVLWPNEPVSHVLLPEDSAGWHYGAFIESNAAPVAVISVFAEACPIAIDNAVDNRGGDGTSVGTHKRAIRFRKFACDPAYQGRGIGTKLLLHVISATGSELQGNILWCDAREGTRAWYERRGLEAFGDTFFKGPVKYIRMKIDIDSTV